MRHAKTCALGDVSAFSLIQRDTLPTESSCGSTSLSQDTAFRMTSLDCVKRDGALTVLSLE